VESITLPKKLPTAKAIESTAAFPASKGIPADKSVEKILDAVPSRAIDAERAGALSGTHPVFVTLVVILQRVHDRKAHILTTGDGTIKPNKPTVKDRGEKRVTGTSSCIEAACALDHNWMAKDKKPASMVKQYSG
jgi:hypothetical protein